MGVPHLVLVTRCIGDEPELQQARLDDLHRLVVHILQRHARPRDLHRSVLRLQDDLIDLFVHRREGAAHRIGARDIGGHVAVIARGIDQ